VETIRGDKGVREGEIRNGSALLLQEKKKGGEGRSKIRKKGTINLVRGNQKGKSMW